MCFLLLRTHIYVTYESFKCLIQLYIWELALNNGSSVFMDSVKRYLIKKTAVNQAAGIPPRYWKTIESSFVLGALIRESSWSPQLQCFGMRKHIYIYMGSGRFPGPMELLLQQLVRVSKTRWRWFNLNKSMLLQPLIKKLEVLVMINQGTTYCINDNNDERWMVVLIDFYLTFCKN